LTEFVPPFPPRMSTAPSHWQRMKLWRKNILAGWEEQAFEYEFESLKLMNCLIFLCNTPESVQFAFSSHNASFERKSAPYRHYLIPLVGDGLFVSDGEIWRKRRRIVAPIIHLARLPDFAPTMVNTALEVRDRWAKLLPGTEIDVLTDMAHLTAEIICRTIFGSKLGREHAADVVRGFADYQRHITKIDFITLFGLPDWLPRWYSRPLRAAVRRIYAVLDHVIESSRRRHDRDDVSIIGRLLEARDQDSGAALDTDALRHEAAVLLMAGHETTANTLAWAWYLLSQMPEVEARLHAEVDQVLGERTPTLADVPKLVYTRAILEETMRLYPPVPIMSRETLNDEVYNDTSIPKGSIIIVAPWLLHRHKKLWPKPDHFIPERFLPGGDGPISKFAYIPFSIGPRICAGMAFGLTEAILSMSTLAQSFKLRLKPGHRIEMECHLTLRPGETLPMSLHRRSRQPSAASDIAAAMSPLTCPMGH
jgi:cytochrome P450